MIRITIAFLGLTLLCGCSDNMPSESQAREKVEQSLADYGPLESFTKINGEKIQTGGREVYLLYYEASLILGEDFYFRGGTVLQGGGIQKGKKLGMLGEDATLYPISAGSTFLTAGHVAYRLTDNGWVFHEIETKKTNFCDTKNNISPCTFAKIDEFLQAREEKRKQAEAEEEIRRPGAGLWFAPTVALDQGNSVHVRKDLCIEIHLEAMDGKDNAALISSFDSNRNPIDERVLASVGEMTIFHGPVYLEYKGRLRSPSKVKLLYRQWFKSEKGCPA